MLHARTYHGSIFPIFYDRLRMTFVGSRGDRGVLKTSEPGNGAW